MQSLTTIIPFGQLTGIELLAHNASYADNFAGTNGTNVLRPLSMRLRSSCTIVVPLSSIIFSLAYTTVDVLTPFVVHKSLLYDILLILNP